MDSIFQNTVASALKMYIRSNHTPQVNNKQLELTPLVLVDFNWVKYLVVINICRPTYPICLSCGPGFAVLKH